MCEKVLSLEEIHEATLSIFDFINNFCEQYQLSYFLAYGSLLGCIRHSSFIPWDDDADIWMKREDYDRMIKIFESNYYQIGNIRLCLRESVNNYNYLIARISDMTYKYITKDSLTPDMGVFVDVYPLDIVSSQKAYQKANNKIENINRMYAIYCGAISGNHLKRFVKNIVRKVLLLIYRDNYLIVVNRQTKKILSKFHNANGDFLGVIGWFTTGGIVYPKEYFDERIQYEFAGRKVWIPSKYDELLTSIYGDYMVPPPENQRKQYHGYKIIKRNERGTRMRITTF